MNVILDDNNNGWVTNGAILKNKMLIFTGYINWKSKYSDSIKSNQKLIALLASGKNKKY